MTDISGVQPEPGGGNGAEPSRRAARSGHSVLLYWPLHWLWAIFRPLTFFRTKIHEMPLSRTIIGGALDVTIAVGIIGWGIAYEEGGYFDREEWIYFLLLMAGLWVASLIFIGGLALLMIPAVMGATGFRKMFVRALRIVVGSTAVYPAAAALATVMILNGRYIERNFIVPVVGDSTRGEPTFVGLITALCAWPFILLIVGLFVDGFRTRSEPHATGDRRCEECGYSLVVLAPDGRCPECGHPASSSMDENRRKLPLLESLSGFWCVPSAADSFARALVRPLSHWRRWRVRCSGRRARNAYLCMLLTGGAFVGLIFVAVFPFVLWLIGDRDDAFEMEPVIVVAIILSSCAVVLFLLGNQTALLLAIALAKLRGNPSRIDELSRIGYYALGLPVLLECCLAVITLMLAIACNLITSYRFRRLYGVSRSQFLETSLILAACLAGALVAAVGLWSLVSMVRGMRAARHANY